MPAGHTLQFAGAVARRLAPLAAALLTAGLFNPLHAQQLICPTTPIAGISQANILAPFGQLVVLRPHAATPVISDQGTHFILGGPSVSTPVVYCATVAIGQPLFLNLFAVIYRQDTNETEVQLRALANDIVGTVNSMSIMVNGMPALLPTGYASLNALRNESPLFALTVATDNFGGWPSGALDAIVDG